MSTSIDYRTKHPDCAMQRSSLLKARGFNPPRQLHAAPAAPSPSGGAKPTESASEQLPAPLKTPLHRPPKASSTPATVSAPVSNKTFSGPRVVASPKQQAAETDAPTLYFSVMYCKFSKKKHKTYDDGLLVFQPGKMVKLQGMDGKDISSEHTRLTSLRVGETLSIRSYDAEVVNPIPSSEYESGRIFIQSSSGADAPKPGVRAPASAASALAASVARSSAKLKLTKAPKRSMETGEAGAVPRAARCRFDPFAPEALVLQWPPGAPRTKDEATLRLGEGTHSSLAVQQASGIIGPDGLPLVPVVVDPALSAALRPHQRQGVEFLWQCIVGLRDMAGFGAILADEMGLGKTLQAITLVYTALKQSASGRPLASKAVIVCPSSLVANWRREFRKWLGDQKCRPIAVTKSGKAAEDAVKDFCLSSASVAPVLIISYEQFRKYSPMINGSTVAGTDDEGAPVEGGQAVGLLVCDEGHRLKNSDGNQTIAALNACPTRRRVILTGTPIQNRLDELYACCSFANPDILGPLPTFRRVFQLPIQRGRDKSATPAEQAIGSERSRELARVASQFVLRRTQRILDKYLPPKTESIVFCNPTECQLSMYSHILRSASMRRAERLRQGASAATAEALMAINVLRKLCNSPTLLWKEALDAATTDGAALEAHVLESGTLQSTAAAVVAAMHRQFGLLGGSGGKPARSAPAQGGTRVSKRPRDEAKQDEDVEGDDDSIGSLEDFIVDDLSSGDEEALAAKPSKRVRHAVLPVATGCSLVSGILPLFPPSSPDPVREALLPLMSADGRSIAAGRTLPVHPSAVPRGLSEAGSLLGRQSGKVAVVDAFLQALPEAEKVVIVSNYTTTLDVLSLLCCSRGLGFLRLDGSTAVEKRQELVNAFNSRSHPARVFLLSSHAGGVGLNLIGANRLVMVDVAWNPATDRQAMARVWRDGQSRTCHIYRLVLSGSLEEKILQRQLMKEEVSASIVNEDSSAVRSFSADELKRLFEPAAREALGTCETYRVISAKPAVATVPEEDDGLLNGDDEEAMSAQEAAPARWEPYTGPEALAGDDAVLARALGALPTRDAVSYVRIEWFNRGGGVAGVSRLNGAIAAAPGRSELRDLLAAQQIALTARNPIGSDSVCVPEAQIPSLDPIGSAVFQSILSGSAAPVL
jgi:SNF2 family DNA or RNA helicase